MVSGETKIEDMNVVHINLQKKYFFDIQEIWSHGLAERFHPFLRISMHSKVIFN